MNHEASVDHPIQDILRQRWSPYVFDPQRAVATPDLLAIFEAARWAMSSYNAQPWRYIVGARDSAPELWSRILGVLVEANQAWAQHAPVLALGIVEHRFERNDKENKAAVHDLGAASAFLTVEAQARGLSVHQMIGIEPEEARREFAISGSLEPYTALAIGYAGDPETADRKLAERDSKARTRKPLEEILLQGKPEA